LERRRILRLNSFAVSILILQVIVYFVTYANIPIARVIICFMYLLFVPGIVILKLLMCEVFDISEKILLSVGLSIAFLMFFGLLTNELGKLVSGNPLSLNPLILSVNSALLLLTLFTLRGSVQHSSSLHQEKTKISRGLLPILLSICLLLSGSYGIFLVNYSGYNLFLFILIVEIVTVVTLVLLKEKFFPSQWRSFLIWIIYICALLFLSTAGYVLVTRYIIWLGDQWNEYYCFRLTGQLWNPMFYVPSITTTSTYSMLSVTILPAIFSNITAMDTSMLFKLLFPIVTSFTAIGAYKLYKTQTDSKTAFLATFFLISIGAFKGIGPSKQEIAQLFYTLLFLLLLKRGIPKLKRTVLLIIFGSALIVSHYSLSYIFLFIIVSSVSILALLEYRKGGQTIKIKSLFIFCLFFSTATFSWYIYINKSAVFSHLCEAIERVVSDLNQFFNPHSRGTALQGLGLVETPTIFHKISSALFILTEIFLVFGFIKLLRDRKDSSFSIEYKIFATVNMGIIAINVLLPRIADTFLMERFYQTTLIILAPLAVIGGKALLELLLKQLFKKAYIDIVVILIFILLFIFQAGFVYEITGSSTWSLSLSKHRTSYVELYRKFGCIDDYYAYGADWLSNNIPSIFLNRYIHADDYARRTELRGYAMIYGGYVGLLSNVTQLKPGDFVYLNPSNTVGGTVIGERYTWSVNDLHFLDDLNKVYENGGSEIYKNGP
jgi:uncharacterized membrane protein